MKAEMDMGIDKGYSSTKIVVLAADKIIYKFLDESLDAQRCENKIRRVLEKYKGIRSIGITGGKSAKESMQAKIPVFKINEINAIGSGGLFLSKKKEAIVMSCGTGTCLVHAYGHVTHHLGGSGVGGGTIVGLGRIVTRKDHPLAIEKLSKRGDLSKVDIQVKDILGGPIGIIPEEGTAANFGKKGGSKADQARALLNLVAEVTASMAVITAKSVGKKEIVVIGRVSKIQYVLRRMKYIAKMLKCKILCVEMPEYATAIGAALQAKSRR